MALELLTGTFESTLDEKGRVGIPARLRDRFGGELVITQGRNFCVWIMAPETFEQLKKTIEQSLADSTFTYEEFEAFQYQLVAPAQVTEIDAKSGRIAVPAAIRSYAKLSRNCLVLSIEGHLEIWDADSYYRSYMETIQQTTQQAAKKLGSKRLFGNAGNAVGGGQS